MQIGPVTFASLISITVVDCSVSVCAMHECPCGRVKMKAVATLCSAWASPSLGDLVFISPDLAHTLEYLLQVPALLSLTTYVRGGMFTELRGKTRTDGQDSCAIVRSVSTAVIVKKKKRTVCAQIKRNHERRCNWGTEIRCLLFVLYMFNLNPITSLRKKEQ